MPIGEIVIIIMEVTNHFLFGFVIHSTEGIDAS